MNHVDTGRQKLGSGICLYSKALSFTLKYAGIYIIFSSFKYAIILTYDLKWSEWLIFKIPNSPFNFTIFFILQIHFLRHQGQNPGIKNRKLERLLDYDWGYFYSVSHGRLKSLTLKYGQQSKIGCFEITLSEYKTTLKFDPGTMSHIRWGCL